MITQAQFLETMSEIFKNASELVARKNKDYGENNNPFKSFAISEALGYSVEESILIRLGDKLSRLTTLLRTNKVNVTDESIEDTLMDMVVYPAIALAKRKLTNEKKDTNN